jgi:ribosomal-protein-alanine N-acetyltransferase
MTLLKNIIKPEDLFKNLPELETMRLKLRRLSMHDAGDIFEYASDPEVSKYVLWEHHRTIAESKSYLKHVLFLYDKGIPASWGIVHKEDNKLIGTGGFQWWSVSNSKAEVGYVISKLYWNKGYMTEALEEILRFGFEQMELQRIEAKCFLDNNSSERVMQKCGMKLEGILRSYKYVKGNFGDFKLYSILRSEFQQNLRI